MRGGIPPQGGPLRARKQARASFPPTCTTAPVSLSTRCSCESRRPAASGLKLSSISLSAPATSVKASGAAITCEEGGGGGGSRGLRGRVVFPYPESTGSETRPDERRHGGKGIRAGRTPPPPPPSPRRGASRRRRGGACARPREPPASPTSSAPPPRSGPRAAWA